MTSQSFVEDLKPSAFESVDVILVGVLTGIVALLDIIGTITFPIGVPGVSGFYIGAAFFFAFLLWFDVRAFVALYIGSIVAALLTGRFTIFVFALAFTNALGALAGLLVFRALGGSPTIDEPKDYVLVGVAGVAYGVVAATYFFGGSYVFGLIPGDAIPPAATGFVVGDVLAVVIFGIPLLKLLTPYVRGLSFADV